ncbi:hypothetical protein PACTADRAFT_3981 [Pachysolen tannophilus NRRL Y-2460]|uniref:MOSC domain-containing protein n=1 Tax=Pachysolen tannophilus NRRL Y-2460 TaxID=669874 RepID=A0A1E4TTM2_PACTA|nr:hypothetical protein PACTADRAFT_3981 [Pachysolen tannophilus NRRL Y-2460]
MSNLNGLVEVTKKISGFDFFTFFITLLAISLATLYLLPILLKLFYHYDDIYDLVNTYKASKFLIKLVNLNYKISYICNLLFVQTLKTIFFNYGDNKNSYSSNIRISAIIIYPIKSVGKGLKLQKWVIDKYGLKYDRQFSLAIKNSNTNYYEALTLKDNVKQSLVEYSLEIDENNLEFFVISYNSKFFFKIPAIMTNEFIKQNGGIEVDVDMWGVKSKALNLQFCLPENFKEIIGLPRDCTLLYSSIGHPVKTCSPKVKKENNKLDYRYSKFQDYYPLLLLSELDLKNLEQKLIENNFFDFKITDYSFRPNLIVDGIDLKPHEEDNWYKFQMINHKNLKEKHLFRTSTKCARCTVPNINFEKDNAKMDKKSPVSKTLSKYRRVDIGSKYNAFFGIYCVNYDDNFEINVGDYIEVLERKVNIFEDPS